MVLLSVAVVGLVALVAWGVWTSSEGQTYRPMTQQEAADATTQMLLMQTVINGSMVNSGD